MLAEEQVMIHLLVAHQKKRNILGVVRCLQHSLVLPPDLPEQDASLTCLSQAFGDVPCPLIGHLQTAERDAFWVARKPLPVIQHHFIQSPSIPLPIPCFIFYVFFLPPLFLAPC